MASSRQHLATHAFMTTRILFYIKDFLLATISACLLVLSFPSFDLGWLAWVGLVPLLAALTGKSLGYSFVLSQVCGLFFFIGAFNWIVEIQKFRIFHHMPLLLYTASYFGLFGLFFSLVSKRLGPMVGLTAAPVIWTALEFIRSNMFFLALPWGLLAHTQYQNLPVLQICTFTGAYGISFLITMVNGALAALIIPYVFRRPDPKGHTGRRPNRATLSLVTATGVLILLVLLYGNLALSGSSAGKPLRISVVQGNIEQTQKWDPEHAGTIMQIYAELSKQAAGDLPDLIVWPETVTPRSINEDPRLYHEVKQIAAKASAPILLGSAQRQKFRQKEDDSKEYFNSAYLISPLSQPEKNQPYNKIRLLPWGEYLPLKDFIPWSSLLVPELSGYLPGEGVKVFHYLRFRFGVTICWENIFPDLFREFILKGAQFMVNITNEAWFGQSAVPYQFLAMSVLRAVENRVFVVRCANTGISCFIDPYGRILDRVKDARGKDIFVRGLLTGTVIPMEGHTFYTRYGNWPAWLSLLGFAGVLITAIIRKYHGPRWPAKCVADLEGFGYSKFHKSETDS